MSNSVPPPWTAVHQAPCPWDSPGKNTGVGCHVLLQCMKVKSESEVAQSYPTPSDPMDCSLPGSSCRTAPRYCYVSLEGERGPHPKAALQFLDCFSLVSASPPSLYSNCLNLPTGTQGRSWRLKEAYLLQSRDGGTQKVFVPRSPTVSESEAEKIDLHIT